MSNLPYILKVNIKHLNPESFNLLISDPYSVFLNSAINNISQSRYSFFASKPTRIFSSFGAFITINNRTFIDSPVSALKKFEDSIKHLPCDPYLPFHGGLIGYIGHNWPNNHSYEFSMNNIPDAWFGLFDTVFTFDHLEQSAWISSYGIDENGHTNINLAKHRAENLHKRILFNTPEKTNTYLINPLTPPPASNFSTTNFIKTFKQAETKLMQKEWDRVNLAMRFHAPIHTNTWEIHKHFQSKNPTSFSSFLRCGNFELSSNSPSGFLAINNQTITCSVIEKTATKKEDDRSNQKIKKQLLDDTKDKNITLLDDEISLEKIFKSRPTIMPSKISSDHRNYFISNEIIGNKKSSTSVAECLASAVPGASMTGVPKIRVNNWLRKTEPARREIYTGTIGFISPKGNAMFNMAVRTMIQKNQIAYIYSGHNIVIDSDPEEIYFTTKQNMKNIFNEINKMSGKAIT